MARFRQIVLEKELEERLAWLVFLRWFAAAGVAVVIIASQFILRLDVPILPLLGGNALLLVYNLVCWLCIRRIEKGRGQPTWFKKATRLGNLQIFVDLFLLAYLIHFAGGVENPFILFFIFHMVIASILLSNLAAYLQATWALILLWGLFGMESTGLLPHLHLEGFLPDNLCLYHTRFLPGLLAVFTGTLYLVVYMTTSIVNRMREGEHQLAIANKKLAEQDRLKSEYVLKVSHDLQSSLSTIQSLLDNIIQGYMGPVSNQVMDRVIRAERRSNSLIRFVKELLDLSRMRTVDKLEKEPVRLKDRVTRALDQFKVLADEKRQTLSQSVDENAVVMANPVTLDELLANLVGNGVRYTPEGGQITIRQEKDEDGFIKLSVSDTGIGIPKESLPHIFEDFFRADNAKNHAKEGTGLGLSIVRQIVKGHGGKITVSSETGKGTTFTFTLPRAHVD